MVTWRQRSVKQGDRDEGWNKGNKDEQRGVRDVMEIEQTWGGEGVVEKRWHGTGFFRDPSAIWYLTVSLSNQRVACIPSFTVWSFLTFFLECVEFFLCIIQKCNDFVQGFLCYVKLFPSTFVCVIHAGNIPQCPICLNMHLGYYCLVFDGSSSQASMVWAQEFRAL